MQGRGLRSLKRSGLRPNPRHAGAKRRDAPRPFGVLRGSSVDPVVTLAKTFLGLATRDVAKVVAHTNCCYINRMPGCPRGRIEVLRA